MFIIHLGLVVKKFARNCIRVQQNLCLESTNLRSIICTLGPMGPKSFVVAGKAHANVKSPFSTLHLRPEDGLSFTNALCFPHRNTIIFVREVVEMAHPLPLCRLHLSDTFNVHNSNPHATHPITGKDGIS